MRKYITAALLAGALTLGITLTACGSSGPPNATQILQSDGYTPSAAYTQALQQGLGSSGNMITSSQAGTNSSGEVQLVIVLDNAADASAGASAVTQQYGSDGITVVQNGDVVTATGALAAFVLAGNGS